MVRRRPGDAAVPPWAWRARARAAPFRRCKSSAGYACVPLHQPCLPRLQAAAAHGVACVAAATATAPSVSRPARASIVTLHNHLIPSVVFICDASRPSGAGMRLERKGVVDGEVGQPPGPPAQRTRRPARRRRLPNSRTAAVLAQSRSPSAWAAFERPRDKRTRTCCSAPPSACLPPPPPPLAIRQPVGSQR